MSASAQRSSPSPSELIWAFCGLFIGLFLLQLLLAALLRGSEVALSPVTVSGIQALLFTLIAGAALLRPMQNWLKMERRRVRAREAGLRRTAERQEFSAELAAALGHSVDEREARWVLHRALNQISGDAPVELLLTEPGSERMKRSVIGGAAADDFGCPVRRSGDCPAIRSGQSRSGSSRDLDACRLLTERGRDCHGLCLPVTINGHALGVLHTARDDRPSEEARIRLQAVAEQAGVRLGLFRAMAASQEAAATDALTSLLNRRALAERIAALDATSRPYSVVIADIDHFKKLNDTYGHQLGDRALQAFAQALSRCVGPEDIAARFGGEEFVVVLPDADSEAALTLTERFRRSLPAQLSAAALPPFTTSFGIADSRHGRNLSERLRAADDALYTAKNAGRDRAICAPLDAALREVS
jgi:diguanylate cyclase (GGDEF)-like protein